MSNKTKAILAGAVAFSAAINAPVVGFAQTTSRASVSIKQSSYAEVTTSVNLRTSASWSGAISNTIKKGEKVFVVSTTTDWSKVQYGEKVGYVATQYLQTPATTTTVTASVKLRKTAAWTTTEIHTIKTGEEVNLLEKGSDFSKVQHNGKIGYVPTQYLKTVTNSRNENTTNTPTPAPTPNSSTVETMNKSGKVINLVSGDTLNVRKEASSTSTIVTKLNQGTIVTITGKDTKTGWYRITHNGNTGFVSDRYIEVINTSNTTIVGYKKTTDNLNMRTGPSTSYSAITKIPAGTTVGVISTSNGWDYVEYNGQKGYCSSSYLVSTTQQPSTITVKKVTTTSVNFRTGPSTSYTSIAKIPEGAVVDVISTSGTWAKVKYNNQEGYVHTDYLKTYTGSSSTTPTLPPSNSSYSTKTIVIDPGHGGHDPGAVSFGRNEKDIALSISKKINANLKTLGFKTIMTRSTDVYIPLSERYSIANRNNADTFVSIHLNAGASSAAGIETLYKTNQTLASKIQTEIISATNGKDRGLKYRSDLAVLNGTKMPAALVETGFISNATESSRLATSSYQDKLAVSIAKGIAKFTDTTTKR